MSKKRDSGKNKGKSQSSASKQKLRERNKLSLDDALGFDSPTPKGGGVNGLFLDEKSSPNSVSSKAAIPTIDPRIPRKFQTGLDYHQKGDYDKASELYREVLALNPNHSDAVHFLGMVYFVQGNLEESLKYVERSIQMKGDTPVYYNNYGAVLKEAGKSEEAKIAFEKALLLDSRFADALSNLGVVCGLLKESNAVIEAHLKAALEVNPVHTDALQALSDHYIKISKFTEAGEILERILALDPNNLDANHKLACIWGERGDYKKAKLYFRKAAALPGGLEVWRWKHLWYCPAMFENYQDSFVYFNDLVEDLDEALAEKKLYDWKTLVHQGFTHSFNLPHFVPGVNFTVVLEQYAELFAPSFPFERPTWKPAPGAKIRFGILLTPGHEGGFLRYIHPFVQHFNPHEFEIFLIYHEESKARIFDAFNAIKSIRIHHLVYENDFEKAVRDIRDLKCDFMYYWKVAADRWGFYLPMCFLAPIQFTSNATHGGSGMNQIDYRPAWKKIARIPCFAPDSPTMSERRWFFEENYFFEPRMICDQPLNREQLDLPPEGAIYLCPQRIQKFHPQFDFMFQKILELDPAGHIVFLRSVASETKVIQERLRTKMGPDQFRRVLFIQNRNTHHYYQYLMASTLVLDMPTFSNGIVAADAFSFGIPCATIRRTARGYTEWLYQEMGITEPIGNTFEEYLQKAVRMGVDPAYRDRISQQILQRSEKIFNNQAAIREWERFLKEVVAQGPPPEEKDYTEFIKGVNDYYESIGRKRLD